MCRRLCTNFHAWTLCSSHSCLKIPLINGKGSQDKIPLIDGKKRSQARKNTKLITSAFVFYHTETN